MFYLVRHGHRHDQGSFHERQLVNVTYDPKLTKIGEWMAFKTGMELMEEIGRDKEIMFISSPFYRCLQTCDFMLCGMISSETNVYKNKIFVEDLVREHADSAYYNQDEYKELEFFKGDKHTHLGTLHNTFENFKECDEILEIHPENEEHLIKRTELFLKQVAKFAKEHPNIVPIITSHGFSISVVHKLFAKKQEKCVPNYCGVCKFTINDETNDINTEYINKRFY